MSDIGARPARIVGAGPIPEVPATLVHLLVRAAAHAPDREALVCSGRRLTYAEYLRQASGLAGRLRRDGFAGERIGLMLGNSIEMAVASFAVHMAGAQSVLLNPAYTARELGTILADAEPSLVLHQPGSPVIAALAEYRGERLEVGERAFESGEAASVTYPTPETLATLQYTGGTTGRPKGVNLTHRAIVTNVLQREAMLPTRSDDRVLSVTPLFHSYATAMGLYLAAHCGGTLVIMQKYSAEATLTAIEEEKISIFLGSPTLFVGLMSSPKFATTDFSSLRICFSGSAALPADTLAKWERAAGCKVYEGYGQTEAGPILTHNSPASGTKPGSVGVPLPGTVIEIVDLKGGNTVLAEGESGEIRARGPQIMSGYRNAPAETARTLREGWLYTGDIGSVEADATLTIRGRKKELVIVGGFNVYPREVEDVLLAFPGVREAAVIGVPDPYRGEALHAFVVASHANSVTEELLLKHCADNLTRYKIPSSIVLRADLPKTSIGKVDKNALRTIVEFGRMMNANG